MTRQRQYDAIILGAGQGGVPLARALAEAGWKTALVEKRFVGGTCINVGCTPTKTMVASAKMAYMARRSHQFGVKHGPVTVDLGRVVERKDQIVQSFRRSNRDRLEAQENLSLLMGTARFLAPKILSVALNDGAQELELTAPVIVIDVGARPRIPRLEGVDGVGYLTSTDILDLKTLPQRLMILGGGYIGVEFAQMYRRFGAEVTLVQRGSQLLAREDEDVASAVRDILEEDGVRVILDANPQAIHTNRSGHMELRASVNGVEETFSGTHLLLAAGRVPNTDTLDVEAAGLQLDDRGFLKVDDQLRTNVEGVFGLGDVKGGPAFTHISYDDYRVLAANLLDGEGRGISERMVPYTVFIDPQLGRVGLGEAEARRRDPEVRVAKMPMDYVSRAIEIDEARGFMKAIVDSGSDQILGATVLGVQGGELMGALQIAMMAGMPYTALRDGIFTHPTLVEAFNNLFASFN